MELVLGAGVVAVTLALLASRVLRRNRPSTPRAPHLTDAVRRAVMAAVSIGAASSVLPAVVPGLRRTSFGFCSVCPISTVATGGIDSAGEFVRAFLLATWYYAATVLPIFILACLLSGVLTARWRTFRISGVVPAFGLAALLPICSCGVVPLGKAMIDRGGTGPRDGLILLATAPLLSPIILSLGFTVLGPAYVAVRVVASLVIALVAATLVRPLLESPRVLASEPDSPVCNVGRSASSVLLSGWGFLTHLVRYVLYGTVLGAIVTAAIPPDAVAAMVRRGALSMAAAVVVGVPINMCAGEEILLSAPLVGAGLTMGHALAFALASTGICVGSIPLLAAVLGKRATLAMVAVYIVVPFLLGMAVNALPFAPSLGPKPF